MKVRENEAMGILEKYGILAPKRKTVNNASEAQIAAEEIGFPVILKAEIGFGGRGKGQIPGANLSGIEQANTIEQAYKIASEMLGKHLITTQTGPEGVIINQVLVEEKISDIIQEFYLSVSILDGLPVIMVSKHGGVDIEKVDNRRIVKERISPLYGVDDDVQQNSLARALASRLKLSQHSIIIDSLVEIAFNLYWLFQEKDCTLIEINPLGLTEDYQFIALDAKMEIDDNAMPRHPEFKFLIDEISDPLKRKAKEYNLGYVRVDSDIACMGNGASITMGTRDAVADVGGKQGDFLDLGGSAGPEQIKHGLGILCSNTRTKVIFINIFGGMFRVDIFAETLIEFVRNNNLEIPLVLRLEGNELKKGIELLKKSGLDFTIVDNMAQGIEQAIRLATGGQKK